METTDGKYYKPEITEFHYGFEYESYHQKHTEPAKWYKEKVSGLVRIDNFKEYLAMNTIRVPFLSHEDIIECGWTFEGKNEEFGFACYQVENGFELQVWGNNQYTIERNSSIGRPTIHFCGTILNKSELKFQMKRLGITK